MFLRKRTTHIYFLFAPVGQLLLAAMALAMFTFRVELVHLIRSADERGMGGAQLNYLKKGW